MLHPAVIATLCVAGRDVSEGESTSRTPGADARYGHTHVSINLAGICLRDVSCQGFSELWFSEQTTVGRIRRLHRLLAQACEEMFVRWDGRNAL